MREGEGGRERRRERERDLPLVRNYCRMLEVVLTMRCTLLHVVQVYVYQTSVMYSIHNYILYMHGDLDAAWSYCCREF